MAGCSWHQDEWRRRRRIMLVVLGWRRRVVSLGWRRGRVVVLGWRRGVDWTPLTLRGGGE